MVKRVISMLVLTTCLSQVRADGNMQSEDFLDACRQRLLGYSWVKMKGTMNHRDANGKRSRPIEVSCAARLVPNKITFKATLSKDQSIKIVHVFGQKHDTETLENTLKDDNGFNKVGIKPSDLSLAFMYWDYIKEYEAENIGMLGRIKCRVYLLANPDGKDFAKVWLSEKYLGPLRVHWLKSIKQEDQDSPQQTLEFKGFAEKNKVWVPEELKITNEKGQLQILFKDVDAALSPDVPEDLYETAP